MRINKFCKYLPRCHWQPWAYTVDARHYKDTVVDELEGLTNLKIIRVPYSKLPGIVFLVKMFFPVLVVAFTLINRSKLKAVYFTGSPFHPFLSTVIITGIFRIPTILDFRDSWSSNHGYDGQKASGIIEKIREKFIGVIEKASIRFSSRSIFSTKVLHEEYSNKYPSYSYKFTTITNGYDPDDFLSIIPNKIVDTKSIILTGKFRQYTPEVVTGLFDALKVLENLTFIYVGAESEEILALAKETGVADKVVSLPYMPYSNSLELIAAADYAMMTNGMMNGAGTKIFDYLALNKPTICFVPKGSVINRQFKDVRHVIIQEAPHTSSSILLGIEKLLTFKFVESKSLLKKYCRITAAERLASVLNDVT